MQAGKIMNIQTSPENTERKVLEREERIKKKRIVYVRIGGVILLQSEQIFMY